MLVLIPAGFLVLMLLAALAVDSAVTFLGHQQLRDALSAAANDSVAAGLNHGSFYRSGTVILDPVATGQAVCVSILAQGISGLHDLHVAMSVDGDSLRLIGHAQVDAVFGRSIPGYGRRTISASASAELTNGPITGAAQSGATFTDLDCGP